MAKPFKNGVNPGTGSVNPANQAEGDYWFRTDLHRAWIRDNNQNLELHGSLTDRVAGSPISATTAKTTICSTAVNTGLYWISFKSTCSTSSGSMTTTVDFSGTASTCYDVQNYSSAAITGALANTTFGSALLGSTTSPLVRVVSGLINITVAGTLTISHTAATSFTIPAYGAFLNVRRVG